jgi:hypothetical protein
MSGAEGYQKYVDTSAKAATGAGIEHHDPAVRAKQASMGMPLAGAGHRSGGDPAGMMFLLLGCVIVIFAAPLFAPTIFVWNIAFEHFNTLLALPIIAVAFCLNAWLLFKAIQKLPSILVAIIGAINCAAAAFFLFTLRSHNRGFEGGWEVTYRGVDETWLLASCVVAAVVGFFLFRFFSRLLNE